MVSLSHLHPTKFPSCFCGLSRFCFCFSQCLTLGEPGLPISVTVPHLYSCLSCLPSFSPCLQYFFVSSQLSALCFPHVCISPPCVGASLRTLSQYQYPSIPEYPCFLHVHNSPRSVSSLTISSFHVSPHVSIPLYLASPNLPQSLGNLAILLPSSLFYLSVSPTSPSPRNESSHFSISSPCL